MPAVGEGRIVLERDGLTITAFVVDHSPVRPAVGYRFDFRGRSVVVSGDTKKNTNLQRFAAGVDLLVHELRVERLVKITHDILDYHTTPVEAAQIARDAGVGYLLYNHIVPPLPLPSMEEIFLDGVAETWSGPVSVGRDGTLVRLPADSEVIELDELL